MTEAWNQGVLSPTLDNPAYPDAWASRTGDSLVVAPPLFSDSASRAGFSRTSDARTVVHRNGQVIYDEPGAAAFLDVPAAGADYRVEMSASRDEPFALSTAVTSVWTFHSSHVDGDQPRRLPLTTVRFAPPVDDHNAVPAGSSVLVPVLLSTQPDAGTAANRTLTVEVSFDDGANWQEARVAPRGGHPAAVIHSPRQPGFVSLRATATDTAGNTVTVTIIRAYRTTR